MLISKEHHIIDESFEETLIISSLGIICVAIVGQKIC